MFWKFNYNINQNHRLMHGYHDDYYWIPGIADGVHRAEHDRPEPRRQPDAEPGLHGRAVDEDVSRGALFGLLAARARTIPNENGQPRVQTRYEDQDTGLITGGITNWAENRSWRYGYRQAVALTDRLLGGSHDLKLGLQYGAHGSDNLNGPNDTYPTISVTGRPSHGTTQLPYHQGADVRWTWALYVDDTYRARRAPS